MICEDSPRDIGDAYEIALAASQINLINDGSPHEALRRVVRRAGLPFDAHHGANVLSHRHTVSAE